MPEDPAVPGPERVRAAGGVVVRAGATEPEVLVVHRPRYDDWSLPKGKCDRGETDEAAARREVEEESGVCVDLRAELPRVEYVDRHGRPKRVRYWRMTVVEDRGFRPSDEVDEIRWVPASAAAALLTYDHDRALVGLVEAEA